MYTILIAHRDVEFAEQLGSPADMPDFGTLRGIRNPAPHVHAAADEPARLLRQIRTLLAPIQQPTANGLAHATLLISR